MSHFLPSSVLRPRTWSGMISYLQDREGVGRKLSRSVVAVALLVLACSEHRGEAPLRAEVPLHLEDWTSEATIEGSEIPDHLAEPVKWSFGVGPLGWNRAYPFEFDLEPARLESTSAGLRLQFDTERDEDGEFVGGLYIGLPEWRIEEWAHIAVDARAQPGAGGVCLGYDLSDPNRGGTVVARGPCAPLIADGTRQTYLLPADQIQSGEFDGEWSELVLWFWAGDETVVDVSGVTAIPKEAEFATQPFGMTQVGKGQTLRRSLFVHSPARIEYTVVVPPRARLDVELGVVKRDAPVRFSIDVGQGESGTETLLREELSDPSVWHERTIDLTLYEGRTVRVGLEASSNVAGAVGLWGAPTLSGSRRTERPNIVFYVIDGAAADHMGPYGYERATTPRLDELAAEGAVFEAAYSNSSWTRPSTLSFLTSLQHSALGGLRNGRNAPPVEVKTAAELLHEAGYQTAFFTSNPNAGTMSGLGRGVDVMRETEFSENRPSSGVLQDQFFQWRQAYPGEPYWVHLQTTDVHSPNRPVEPFAGTWGSPDGGAEADRMGGVLDAAGAHSHATPYMDAFEEAGFTRAQYFSLMRDLYDETMLQQDESLGQLVDRLKASGEWEHTLLIVASDHSHAAGTRHFGLGLLDPLPAIWEGAIASSFQSKIPLIFIWPGRIDPGLRIAQPVSMIDILPTVLDLLDIPQPEYLQGQSLAPLLLGEGGWQARPVILDEFNFEPEEGWRGQIEMIDGRWAASLYLGPPNPDDWIHLRGHRTVPPAGSSFRNGVPSETPRLLLYDLWKDPHTQRSVHAEHPDLVQKYRRLLEAELRHSRNLGESFTRSADSALRPDQLETLQALGYIQ